MRNFLKRLWARITLDWVSTFDATWERGRLHWVDTNGRQGSTEFRTFTKTSSLLCTPAEWEMHFPRYLHDGTGRQTHTKKMVQVWWECLEKIEGEVFATTENNWMVTWSREKIQEELARAAKVRARYEAARA